MFTDNTGIETLKKSPENKGENPYASAWEGFGEDMPASPDAEPMFMGISAEQTPAEAIAEQTSAMVMAEQGEEDPSKRTFEISSSELDENSFITESAFENWRNEARRIFEESPEVTSVILINAQTGEELAVFEPSNISAITRQTAVKEKQDTNLFENLSNPDALGAPQEFSSDEATKNLLNEADANNQPDALKINKLDQNSNKNTVLGTAPNAITASLAEVAGNTPSLDTVNIEEVTETLHHQGYSSSDIIREAEKLERSVDSIDLAAGNIAGAYADEETTQKRTDILQNAAIASVGDTVKSAALNELGRHEEAIETANQASTGAESVASAAENIAATGEDNDPTSYSIAAVHDSLKIATGAEEAAETTKSAAEEALANKEAGEKESTIEDNRQAREAVDPNTGIPYIAESGRSEHIDLGDASENENPQDAYFRLLQEKQLKQAEEDQRQQNRVQTQLDNPNDRPHISGAITS